MRQLTIAEILSERRLSGPEPLLEVQVSRWLGWWLLWKTRWLQNRSVSVLSQTPPFQKVVWCKFCVHSHFFSYELNSMFVDVCGATLTADPNQEQEILSPGYSGRNYYLDNTECNWHIKVGNPFCHFQMHFAWSWGVFLTLFQVSASNGEPALIATLLLAGAKRIQCAVEVWWEIWCVLPLSSAVLPLGWSSTLRQLRWTWTSPVLLLHSAGRWISRAETAKREI